MTTPFLQKSRSSVGKKFLMAATGFVLFGFILGHLAGNLLVFAGPDALNAYAKKLRSLGPALWGMRLFLLATVLVHIIVSIRLSLENRAARPITYVHRLAHETSTYASRTMMVSGFIILAFIIYHLMHFTFLLTHPDISHMKDPLGRHDVYFMVVSSFKIVPVSIAYMIAMALLCMHLSHGFSSMFQSLGFNDEKSIPALRWTGRILALLIFLGYSAIPAAALSGLLKAGGTS